MELTADELLRMLDEAGGKTTEYPFIAMGRECQLEELLKQGGEKDFKQPRFWRNPNHRQRSFDSEKEIRIGLTAGWPEYCPPLDQ